MQSNKRAFYVTSFSYARAIVSSVPKSITKSKVPCEKNKLISEMHEDHKNKEHQVETWDHYASCDVTKKHLTKKLNRFCQLPTKQRIANCSSSAVDVCLTWYNLICFKEWCWWLTLPTWQSNYVCSSLFFFMCIYFSHSFAECEPVALSMNEWSALVRIIY